MVSVSDHWAVVSGLRLQLVNQLFDPIGGVDLFWRIAGSVTLLGVRIDWVHY